MMTDFTEATFKAPNLDGQGSHGLHYLDWGSPDAKNTVMCVHGLTRNAHDFDYLARELVKRGNRVLSISMAGRGQSEYLDDPYMYSYPAYMADCMAFLDNFHLRSVDWVGTSMGGIIGMMIAAMHPKRIKRLVLNDVGAFIPASGLKAILEYVSKTPRHFTTRAEAESALRQNMSSLGIDDDAHWQHVFDYSIQPRDGGFAMAFDPRILDAIKAETNDFADVSDIHLGELWEAINIPVLILRGEHSGLLEKETVSAMRAHNMKAQNIEIPNVGHAPALLKPAEYQPISRWLSASGLAPANLRAG
jgi:pimeloyl-ACP methyl ester carboxylesterase